jgi:hypothetical protein
MSFDYVDMCLRRLDLPAKLSGLADLHTRRLVLLIVVLEEFHLLNFEGSNDRFRTLIFK